MSYDNTNSGALFKNKEKESEKHPDYRGQINVNGTEFWLSAWIKKSKAGETFMSLAVSEKDAKKGKPSRREEDEDVPF